MAELGWTVEKTAIRAGFLPHLPSARRQREAHEKPATGAGE
jgi:hypothetical protein